MQEEDSLSLPTQILLYEEVYNKTEDKDFLACFYPMLLQQCRYFADVCRTDANGLESEK